MATRQDLNTVLAARFEQSTAVPTRFFAAESELIANACLALAQRFHQGGRRSRSAMVRGRLMLNTSRSNSCIQ